MASKFNAKCTTRKMFNVDLSNKMSLTYYRPHYQRQREACLEMCELTIENLIKIHF